MTKVCATLETTRNLYGGYDCAEWVELPTQPNPFVELSQLSYAQANELLAAVMLYFAVCWIFKHFGFFIRRTQEVLMDPIDTTAVVSALGLLTAAVVAVGNAKHIPAAAMWVQSALTGMIKRG